MYSLVELVKLRVEREREREEEEKKKEEIELDKFLYFGKLLDLVN